MAKCLESLLKLLTHFLNKTILFQRFGGVHNTRGNSGGVGEKGYFCVQKLEMVWIFYGTTNYEFQITQRFM